LSEQLNIEDGDKMSDQLTCPKCHSHDVKVQVVEKVETKRRGCIAWTLWILLAILTLGLIIIIPLITNSKTRSKTVKMAVYQNCGHTWKIR